MSPPATSESYFQNVLEKRARSDELAAPLLGNELNLRLNYLSPAQVRLVADAYEYAEKAHTGQQRRTGHSYITHPLAVANILASFKLDPETICAALLHDVLEDTNVTKSSLASVFGERIADIVDGVSKLSHLVDSHAEAQALNFYKMTLSMSRDIRVILVKLADRLHNMRTIGVMSRDSRKRIARETMDLFVPLANRLGIYVIKQELERLSFEALFPLRSDRLDRLVKRVRAKDTDKIDSVQQKLESGFREAGINARIEYVETELYSIYRSLRDHEETFDVFMDTLMYRVVVDTTDDCYRALGLAHSLYKPKVRAFRDYISIPKLNGYQSLHVMLVGPGAKSIKLLIRTANMDEVANYGLIAGWIKQSEEDADEDSQTLATSDVREWISNLLNLQDRGDAVQFIENLKTDLFPDEVYVFTPQGDILALPVGSCAVDFAYTVHTDVGNQCVACRIDGQVAPLSTILESGQTVSIVRAAAAHPDPMWLNFVQTAKARSAIRDRLRSRGEEESIVLGKNLLNRSLANANTSLEQLDFRRLRKVFREFNVRKRNEMFEEVGRGNLLAYQVAQRLLEEDIADHDTSNIEHGAPIYVQGGQNMGVRYGRCCGPVPGDDIIGHISQGEGLVVHRSQCGNMKSLEAKHTIMPVSWTDDPEGEFITRLRVDIEPHLGILASLAQDVNALGAGISMLDVTERTPQLSSVQMDVGVRSLKHLRRIIRSLDARTDTSSVQRLTH